MRKLAIAAAALAISGTAYAADMPMLKAPPPVAAPSWTGFYIGINGGGDWGRADTGMTYSPPQAAGFFGPAVGAPGGAILNASANTIHNSGGVAGGQIGYLLQNGSIVAGFEASFDWMRAKGSVSQSINGPNPRLGLAAGNNITINESVDARWLALFTGRVGFNMGAWYPYVTGGLAVASLKHTYSYLDNIAPAFSNDYAATQVRFGPTGGAGLEWRWDNHWSLRAEYLYMAFDDVTGSSQWIIAATGVPVGVYGQHKATFSEHLARAFLSYKF
jgi:outer membrane immunogenic protein